MKSIGTSDLFSIYLICYSSDQLFVEMLISLIIDWARKITEILKHITTTYYNSRLITHIIMHAIRVRTLHYYTRSNKYILRNRTDFQSRFRLDKESLKMLPARLCKMSGSSCNICFQIKRKIFPLQSRSENTLRQYLS